MGKTVNVSSQNSVDKNDLLLNLNNIGEFNKKVESWWNIDNKEIWQAFLSLSICAKYKDKILKQIENDNNTNQENNVLLWTLTDLLEYANNTLSKCMGALFEIPKEKYEDFFKNIDTNLKNLYLDIDKNEILKILQDIKSFDFTTKNEELEKELRGTLIAEIKDKIIENNYEIKKNLVENITLENYQKITKYVLKLFKNGFIDQEFYDQIVKEAINNVIKTVSPEINKKIDKLLEVIEKAKKENNINIDTLTLMEEIKKEIINIKDIIEWWSEAEKMLKNMTEDLEKNYKNKIYELCDGYLDNVISDQILEMTIKQEIEEYENTNTFLEFQKKIKELDEDKQKELLKKYQDIKKEALVNLLLKFPSIKVKNNIVNFWNEQFPVFLREKTKVKWKLDPKIIQENVILSLAETKSNTMIIPTDERRLGLRGKASYEITKKDLQDMHSKLKNVERSWKLDELKKRKKELVLDLENLRKSSKYTFEEEQKDTNITKIKDELYKINKEINENMWHIFKVVEYLNKFNILPKFKWNIPELKENIIVTKSVIDNLIKITERAISQTIRQDGIAILEWEASVWKNVLLDIFWHYTKRPVFTFPCNAKASKEDLTYQWLINENWTYKLHSKVYEAAATPWAILIFDEINTLPKEVIKLLNWLFDYRRTLNLAYDNEKVKACESLLMFWTQNPQGYLWTEPLPQDVSTRVNTVIINYPEFKTSEWVYNYDEALMCYKNVPYFYKLLKNEKYSLREIKDINYLIVKKQSNHALTEQENKKIEGLKNHYLSISEFVVIWNKIFNLDKKDEIIDEYWELMVSWMYDIYKLLEMGDYIRDRYKKKMEWENLQDAIDRSIWQRDLNKMMELLCNWKKPLDAFIEIYSASVQNVDTRKTITDELITKFRS